MKTLIITLASTTFAALCASCCCNDNGSKLETKHYDSRGRLIKDVHHDGNYTTYDYGDTAKASNSYSAPKTYSAPKSYRAPVKRSRGKLDNSWMPRLP